MRRRTLLPVAVARPLDRARRVPSDEGPAAGRADPAAAPAAPGGIAATPAVLHHRSGVDQPRAHLTPTSSPSTRAGARFRRPRRAPPRRPRPRPTTTTTTTTTPGSPTACYYAYTTPTFRFVPTGVPVYRSTDLVHWIPAGPADTHGDPSGIAFDGNVPGAAFPLWAPSVDPDRTAPLRDVVHRERERGRRHVPVVRHVEHTRRSVHLSPRARTATPARVGSSTPHRLVDNDGTVYLTYKSEGIASPTCRPGSSSPR